MPELPDLELYRHCLRPRLVGRTIESVTIVSPFLLRSVDPPIDAVEGRSVAAVDRLGKRLVLALDGDRFVVLHLMIAGRLRWFDAPARPSLRSKIALASLRFETGTVLITEAATRRRAAMHVVDGVAGLASHDPGGLEVLDASRDDFAARLTARRRTLKRALTDPAAFAGIGNAYSDEILHAARLAPTAMTTSLDGDAVDRLFGATRDVLATWTARLIEAIGDGFPGPGAVTAFRPEFAVHGRAGKPCPVCGTAVARIVRAENELNYCPGCQTGGRVLRDRSLSRLLRDDWDGDAAPPAGAGE